LEKAIEEVDQATPSTVNESDASGSPMKN